jgi:DNA-binding LytR/AlgR family response regulator
MKISCITVDDEPLALEKMEKFIQKVPFLELKAAFDNALAALDYLKEKPVDLLFLDIQMDELTGIQLLETLERKPQVIMTTAYDEYAIKGYELDVSDYLLKPISFQRFLKAVERVHNQLQDRQKAAAISDQKAAPPSESRPYILVRSEYRLQKIWLDEILYIEGMKDYSRIFTPSLRIMTLQNLKKIEEALETPPFLRVHKSYIISLDKIESIGKNDLVIAGTTIPVGGLYKQTFHDYIDQQNLIG